MWEKIENGEPGSCPKCGSENIDYDSAVHDSNSLYYPIECEECGFKGREYYNLVFDCFYQKDNEK